MFISKANPILSTPYSRTQPSIQGAAPFMDTVHPPKAPSNPRAKHQDPRILALGAIFKC